MADNSAQSAVNESNALNGSSSDNSKPKASLGFLEPLSRSFRAFFRMLDHPRPARYALIGLLAIHTILLSYSAYVHSPTLNEPGHLVAGLSHWKFGRFELYRNNPPLVRMVAALPVVAAGYKEDWTRFSDAPGAMSQFAVGEDFIRANGARAFFLITIARLACIPFSLIGALVCYLWARDLYGRPAGVLACSIWCIEPNILAHASLIAPDAHAAALGLAACYTFWRWLKKPTWSQAAITGVVLGLAELTKTTLILFYPLWPIMWVAYRWSDRHTMNISDWFREAGMLACRMAIGLYIVNLGYGFESTLKPLRDYYFVSEMFTGAISTAPPQNTATSTDVGSQFPSNRFQRSWLGDIPVPLPANYLLGIDIQQRDFEHLSRPSYLRGTWRNHGWWYYYLYAAAIKVPLSLWIMGLFILVVDITDRWFGRHICGVSSWRDTFVLLAPAAIIFLVASNKTGINEHLRYVLTAFPFVFIWLSKWAGNFIDFSTRNSIDYERLSSAAACRLRLSVPLVLLIWFFSSSLWIFPHSLSYFNESIGGPRNGAKHLLGSNVDWGQDLRYLEWWAECVPEKRLFVQGNFLYAPGDLGMGRFNSIPQAELEQVLSRPGIEGTEEMYLVTINRVFGEGRFIDDETLAAPNCDRGQRVAGYTFVAFAAE